MEMILENQFVELVEEQLEKQHMSRSDLARSMGVGRQYVTDYLNRRKNPGPEVMERFFLALGVRPRLSVDEPESGKISA